MTERRGSKSSLRQIDICGKESGDQFAYMCQLSCWHIKHQVFYPRTLHLSLFFVYLILKPLSQAFYYH